MHDLTFTQETDRIADIGIVDETEQVVISYTGFLLRCSFVNTAFIMFQSPFSWDENGGDVCFQQVAENSTGKNRIQWRKTVCSIDNSWRLYYNMMVLYCVQTAERTLE